MRLPSITVASPSSGLRGCHNLGGRARQQSSTDWCLGVLAIVVWWTIHSLEGKRQSTLPECRNGVHAQMPLKNRVRTSALYGYLNYRIWLRQSTDIKVLLVMSPAWPPVRYLRQDQAIVANQANSKWEKEFARQWKHIPQGSGCQLCWRDQLPWWQLPHSRGQGHQVQALLVQKWQRHCWCKNVCGGRVDRESFWGARILQQNHLIEVYSRPACGYLSVCVCPTEWSKW